MQLEIQFFAGAAEIVGARSIELTVPDGSCLREAIAKIVAAYPNLDALAARSRWAVANQFVDGNFEFFGRSAKLAMIPPVSGG
ncbi:MAG: MoaD/ThiS family protein [Pirellulaceae bacterium]